MKHKYFALMLLLAIFTYNCSTEELNIEDETTSSIESKLLDKKPSKVPSDPTLTDIYGTYRCTNCDEIDASLPPGPKTFIIKGLSQDSDTSFTTVLIHNNITYSSSSAANVQSNCSNLQGGLVSCDLAGQSQIGSTKMYWTATHEFLKSKNKDCNYVVGTWSANVSGKIMMGVIESNDGPCK